MGSVGGEFWIRRLMSCLRLISSLPLLLSKLMSTCKISIGLLGVFGFYEPTEEEDDWLISMADQKNSNEKEEQKERK